MSVEFPNDYKLVSNNAALLKRVTSSRYAQDGNEIFDQFLDWVKTTGIEPYPAQEEALLQLISGNHVVLETPTGSGKSLVALGLHFKAMCEGKRSFYTAPIKALVSEKFFSLCELFGEENVGMLTGDASINWSAPIICCTAEVLSNMSLRQGEHTDADYVVMDEFHYYGDRDRGIAWELPLLLLPKSQFLLMSATLGNTASIEERLQSDSKRDVRHIWSDIRPVPLDFAYSKTPLRQTVEDLCHDRRSPIYVVSFTQRDCARFARALTSAKLIGKEEKQILKDTLKVATFDTPYGKHIKKFLSNGIGLHHAGLLPKYRFLVQQLSQQGLLRVICGTDTLGVGVNIPIRTVVFSKLSKFDGEKLRLLTAREFKQISGRAGRKGFDDRGSVVCQAPQHMIKRKASKPFKSNRGGKRASNNRELVWNEKDFQRLIHTPPETLRSQFQIDHGIIVNSLQRDSRIRGKRGGYGDLIDVINRSHAGSARKSRLRREAAQLFRALVNAEIILLTKETDDSVRGLIVDQDLQQEFSLYHSLSLFLVEALDTLSKDDPSYSYDVMSLVESVLEQPRPILYAQERTAKSELRAKLKARRVPYEERVRRLELVTHPKPNAREIYKAFDLFAEYHPWIGEENIKPKSIAREMVETRIGFDDYVRKYRLEAVEGLLLRYLSSVYGTLLRNVPNSAKNESIEKIEEYLHSEISNVDSSLLREWETRLHNNKSTELGSKQQTGLSRNPNSIDFRELSVRIRKELHLFVRALSEQDYVGAASILRKDEDFIWNPSDLKNALVPFFKQHKFLRCDGDARRADRTNFKPLEQGLWATTQVLCDPEGENTWYLEGISDFNVEETSFALRKIGF